MITSSNTIQDFIGSIHPFKELDYAIIKRIVDKLQPLRYRMGQAIFVRDVMPDKVAIVYSGQARLIGYPPNTTIPETLQLYKEGDIFGWASLVRGVACETVIASSETLCFTLGAEEFLKLLVQEEDNGGYFRNQCSSIEVYELLGAELQRRAVGDVNLTQLALTASQEAVVFNLAKGKTALQHLDPNLLWLVSSNGSNYPIGSRLEPINGADDIQVQTDGVRLIGLREQTISGENIPTNPRTSLTSSSLWEDTPYASEPERKVKQNKSTTKYPYIQGRGPIDATLACFQMLSQHWGMPWKRDVLNRALVNNFQRTGKISIELCGALSELMGLKSQLVEIPAVTISQLPTPVLIPWLESFAILYEASEKELIIAIPEQGITRKKTADFAETWGESGQVLLLQATPETPKNRFDLSWFLPAIKKHRTALIEVFIASLFVQLLGLANPLITQVIIDKVIIQNSLNTLNVLGSLLIIMSVIEGIITWLRTNLFVDTTNRIDLSLGSEVIDHLLRLPLRYFEKRPVGEVSSRINELENIRSFLTGTALTVVLDAVFSVIYIVVMVFYSWLLTIVALATIPLFALLTYIFTPIIRNQTRTKAERNAETQSYLVEVIGGIQTVKAQNIELNSRWHWQGLYSKYISASFENVLT